MNQNLLKSLFLIVVLFISTNIFATHAKTAEIIYKHIEGYTYEINIITVSYSPSPADRPELMIRYGDGTTEVLPRTYLWEISSDTRKNIYSGEHTFPGEGSFIMSMEDPNRNYGIVNIPNSVNIPQYVESLLVINDALGPNNSPEFLILPVCDVKAENPFHYNGGALDWDGDLLVYQLVHCKGSNGMLIPGYQLPEASTIFKINTSNGQILWDSPIVQGEYVIAIKTTEWRNGEIIGYVVREYQFLVDSDVGDIPNIEGIYDTTVYYNQDLALNFSSSTSSNDLITLATYGYPFLMENQPANFDSVAGYGSCNSTFFWETNLQHARAQSYYIYLVSTSQSNYGSVWTSVKPVEIGVNYYADMNESKSKVSSVHLNTIVDQSLNLNFTKYYEGNISIRIFSLNGNFVIDFNEILNPERDIELDLSNLQNALYIIEISHEKQHLYSGKILKQ